MKLKKSIFAVIAAALCLASCGRVDTFDKKDDNATLTTTTTAEPVVTDAPTETDVTEDPETGTDSVSEEITTIIPDVTEAPASTKSKVTTQATTTTTTAATTAKPATTTTTTTATSASPAVPENFKEMVKVNYNGNVIGIGDVWSDLELKFGDQTEESRRVFNNDDPEEFEDEFYFHNLIVKVKNEAIISLTLDAEFCFDEDLYPYTVGGISRYSAKEDVENAYAHPTTEDGNIFNYDGDGVYMQVVFGDDGKASKIWIRS